MNNCKKFEELFINSDETEILKHIETCEECREIYNKMNRVSELVQEVKPYYLRKKNTIRALQKIAAVFVFVIFTAATTVIYSNEDFTDTLMYGNTLTAEDYGFPVDSYGLLMVD